MNKQILVPLKIKAEIMRVFGVNRCDLGRALSFKINSGRARVLRAAALQRGGLLYTGLVPEGFTPDCRTEFDHEKGLIIHRFGGSTITISKTRAKVEVTDCAPMVIEGITTDNWLQMVYAVQLMISNVNQ